MQHRKIKKKIVQMKNMRRKQDFLMKKMRRRQAFKRLLTES